MAKNITPRATNFPQWYQDVINAGDLADQAPVKGCMVIKPTGFALWEEIQKNLDAKFKETGHVNVYFPSLIPESFIHKEAEHVEGFSPELAVVQSAGGKKLEEPLVVRPTSETIVGHMFSKWLSSYRDLPLLMNQWCNVVRWEKRPRLFLRTSEFLWQEGHTAHETQKEAETETLQMLDIYHTFLHEVCAIPVTKGIKPEHEKFPGAITTYTVEGMMQDGKALQSATSHNLGQNFSKAFDIKFLDRNNKHSLAWTTSWGASTRLIGGLIMTHSDDDGLIIPPKLAPIKAVILPIFKKDQGQEVNSFVDKVSSKLKSTLGNLAVKIDINTDLRPADRFFHWIQKGIPLRIEVGPKDVQNNQVVIVRRDNKEKIFCSIEKLEEVVQETLESIQTALYKRAVDQQNEKTKEVQDYETFKTIMKNERGFIYAYWDGTRETAEKIQAETKASIRLIPIEESSMGKCIVTGKETKLKVLFAVAY